MQRGLLEGIRILDLGSWYAGIAAGAILGDLGAEAIKIEDPGSGDALRRTSGMYGDVGVVKGRHITFETGNRNKRGITLNLKDERGRRLLHDLVRKSDVFVTNFPEDMLRRLEADYDTLRRHNPRLIYASSSAYGPRGGDSGKRAFDPIAQARSGMMWAAGDRDSNEPVHIMGAICDQMAATMMAFGIVCALLGRERLGISQRVETSLLGSIIHLQSVGVNLATIRGRTFARHTRARSRNPMTNHYRCADGEWLLLAESDFRFWPEFLRVMGLGHLEHDPRFSSTAERRQHSVELVRILDAAFAARPRAHWLETFERHEVHFAYSPIHTMAEAIADPQVLENNYVVPFTHSAFGEVKMAGFPVGFSETPAAIQREAPELGQHTDEVLKQLLGRADREIAELRAAGVI